jgi:small subunit ribosomal protein S18
MAQRREKKAPPGKERRPIKKKTSILITESIDWIDYKDVNLLRRFMSERAKVRARRVTGNTQQQQVAVARAIRVAREMALLPYSVRQVTQRSKGRRDRGERGDRDRGDREGELREIPGAVDRSASRGLDGTGAEDILADEIMADGLESGGFESDSLSEGTTIDGGGADEVMADGADDAGSDE